MNLKKVKSVLFVCTGNSCRSPMAEGFLKTLAKDKLKVNSAGTSAIEGLIPSYDSITAMKEHGIDISDYRSLCVTEDMLKEYDLIVAMTIIHKNIILSKMSNISELKDKVFLLKEFSNDIDEDDLNVLDPIGLPIEIYRQCAKNIKKSVEDLYDLISGKGEVGSGK